MAEFDRIPLMLEVPAGDQMGGEFLALYSREAKHLYQFIRTLVANQADAEDAFQEVSAALWKKFDQFERGSNFRAWALQMARFSVSNLRQRQRRDGPQLSEQAFDVVADDVADMQEVLERQHHALADCYQELTQANRQLIDQRYRTDVSVKELAEKLKRPLRTVYRLLDRVHASLLDCVERKMKGGEQS
jgi:RNA polymerase sigma-70 factor (ECF subfamily)